MMICIAFMYWHKAMGVSSRSLFASEIGEREFALELLVLMELAYSVYMGSSGYHGYITTLLHIMNERSYLVYTPYEVLWIHSCNLPLTVWVIYPFHLHTHHISQCGNPSLSATGRRRGASHAHWSTDPASPLPSKASYWSMVGPVTARRFGDAKNHFTRALRAIRVSFCWTASR